MWPFLPDLSDLNQFISSQLANTPLLTRTRSDALILRNTWHILAHTGLVHGHDFNPSSRVMADVVVTSQARGLSQEIEIQVQRDASTLKSTSSVLSYFSPRKFPLTSLTKFVPYLKLPKPRYSEGSSTQRAHQPSHRSQSQEELSSMDPQKMRSTAEQYANQSIK